MEKLLNNGDDVEAMKNNIRRHRDIFKKNENKQGQKESMLIYEELTARRSHFCRKSTWRGAMARTVFPVSRINEFDGIEKKVEYIVYAKKEISDDSIHY